MVAALARRLGDLQAAEDAAAEAFAAAARAWQRDGVPPNPGGWLTVTAWRKAIDQLRRDRLVAVDRGRSPGDRRCRRGGCGDGGWAAGRRPARDGVRVLSSRTGARGARRDDAALCGRADHRGDRRGVPAARADAGAAAGAGEAEDPRGRGSASRCRARSRAARLDGVRAVIYLVFNEGYAATGGDQLVRADLCEEAIWLGRLLHRLLPGGRRDRGAARADAAAPLPGGGAAGSRRRGGAARGPGPDPLGCGADRRGHRDTGRRGGPAPGPYQIQAAIAALHAAADGFEATDWPQIAALYGTLARLSPSPVVEVNRAVAVGMADGPHAGLAILEPVLATGALTGYAPLHAAHADLLEQQAWRPRRPRPGRGPSGPWATRRYSASCTAGESPRRGAS